MIFGFPNIVHKQYSQNFLKVVVFQIQFNKIQNFRDKKGTIINFFKPDFPRIGVPQSGIEITISNSQTPIVQQINSDENLILKSDSGQKTLNISNTSLTFNITGKEYKSFEALKGEMGRIIKFLETLEIVTLTRIAIRKINVVDFKYTENNPLPVLSSLLNPNLLGNLEYYPSNDSLTQNIYSLVYRKRLFNLNVKYGFNITPIPALGQLIIDLDLFCTEPTSVNDMLNILSNINQEIFNAFNWIISEKLLNLLDA